MADKYTTELFKQEVKNLVGDEYLVLGNYINAHTKILMLHNIEECGHKYEVMPFSFKEGSRCPECSGNKKKTTEIYKQEVKNLVGDEYLVLGDYINSYTKVLMMHNIEDCGYKYEVFPTNFTRKKTRCPKCAGRHKTTEDYKKKIRKLVGNEYIVLGDYKNTWSKILMLHNTKECGHQFGASPNLVRNRGLRCPKCFKRNSAQNKKNRTKTDATFKEEIKNLVGSEYAVCPVPRLMDSTNKW